MEGVGRKQSEFSIIYTYLAWKCWTQISEDNRSRKWSYKTPCCNVEQWELKLKLDKWTTLSRNSFRTIFTIWFSKIYYYTVWWGACSKCNGRWRCANGIYFTTLLPPNLFLNMLTYTSFLFCSVTEYAMMLLDAVFQMHAWASARFKCKNELECQKLEDQNSRILETEKEQGMCSQTPSSAFLLFILCFILCFQILLWNYWIRWYATFTTVLSLRCVTGCELTWATVAICIDYFNSGYHRTSNFICNFTHVDAFPLYIGSIVYWTYDVR